MGMGMGMGVRMPLVLMGPLPVAQASCLKGSSLLSAEWLSGRDAWPTGTSSDSPRCSQDHPIQHRLIRLGKGKLPEFNDRCPLPGPLRSGLRPSEGQEEVKLEATVAIVERTDPDQPEVRGSKSYSDLLAKLSKQCLGRGFPGFHFAAGKLPESRKMDIGGTLLNPDRVAAQD